jgi:hypothetical protein
MDARRASIVVPAQRSAATASFALTNTHDPAEVIFRDGFEP